MASHRIALVFLTTVVCLLAVAAREIAAGAAQVQTQPAAPVQEIEVKARKYEFTPSKIEVALNAVVRIRVTAQDADHGFEIEGIKVGKIDIAKGATGVVEFKAETAGTFKFKCSHFCGFGHGRMKGTIVVK